VNPIHCVGGLLMLGGRMGDLLGRRRMFLAGTALFAVASLACGLATTPGFLIAARVVHGVSAALMAPTALSILVTTFDEEGERNAALAAWGAVGGVGATVALLVGGVLTDAAGWRSIFFIQPAGGRGRAGARAGPAAREPRRSGRRSTPSER
jgi:MFS family permease